MSTTINLREALEADAKTIAEIHVRCWQEVYSFMPKIVHRQRNFEYRFRQWTDWFESGYRDESLFVLESASSTVGFAMAKPNADTAIAVPGEMHACYLLPEHRGGELGPLGLMALATSLKERGLWPACLWAFRENPYRRIYPFLGCKPEVFRERVIAGVGLPEIGYRVTDYDLLIARLDRMRASAAQRQTESLRKPRLLLRLPG